MNTNLSKKSPSGIGKKQLIAIAVLLLLAVAAAVAILRPVTNKADGESGRGAGHSEAKGHSESEHQAEKAKKAGGDSHKGHADEEHKEEVAKGPHGGQLLTEGDFSAEVLIAETGAAPRLQVWLSQKGQALAPSSAKVSAEITRPGGAVERLDFKADKESLLSTQAVAEPHMFEGTLAIQTATEPYLLTFSSSEGLVAMSDAQTKAAGIVIEAAGPANVRSSLQLSGEIRFNEDRTAHVVPRVTGIVESVTASLGQAVRRGDVLAVISSPQVSEQRSELQAGLKRAELARTTYQRERKLWEEKISPEQDVLQAQQALREAEIAVANSQQKLLALGAGKSSGALNRFELRAPFDAMVVEKHIALGEQVKEDANVFTLSDLSTVWAEINVPAKDLPMLRVGERVNIRATAFDQTTTGTVAYVSSLLGEQTRTAKARVTLANPKMAWRPGLFVNAEVVASEATPPVTVSVDAIQTMVDKPVVFLRTATGFVPQPVQTGRSDGKRIEIISGLQPGARYAAAGSFVVKSEAGKASAEHTH